MLKTVALTAAAALGLSTTAAHAGCTLAPFATLPVRLSGPSALVDAKVNGTDMSFIADSGAFFSSVSPGNAKNLNLPTSSPIGWIRGAGGIVPFKSGTVKRFILAGGVLNDVQFVVGGNELSDEAVGSLGQNILHIADVEYDFGDGVIRLVSPAGCDQTSLAYWARDRPFSVIPIERTTGSNRLTIGTATVDGVRLRTLFDTGSPFSTLSLDVAKRIGIHPGDPGVEPAGYVGGVGRGSTPSWIAPVAIFEIGGEKIEKTRLRIGDVGGVDYDMILGLDFFLAHRLYVANSQHKLYFTYEGGPVFDLRLRTTAVKDAMPTSKDSLKRSSAAGSSQVGFAHQPTVSAAPVAPVATADDLEIVATRGEVALARHSYDQAVADLTLARKLAPTEPKYPYEQALALIGLSQTAPATADLDVAIRLKPDYVDALVARAKLRQAAKDLSGARVDLDAASSALTPAANLRLSLARMYLDAEGYDGAVSQFGSWLTAHPDDSRLALALNGRCWARALADKDLDKAVADCQTALRLAPNPDFLGSLGMVRLRRGDFHRAIWNYDQSLGADPKIAWSLYGRGLAELKLGRDAQGRADIAAATALDAKLPDRAAKLGLAPEAFAASAPAIASTPALSAAVH